MTKMMTMQEMFDTAKKGILNLVAVGVFTASVSLNVL